MSALLSDWTPDWAFLSSSFPASASASPSSTSPAASAPPNSASPFPSSASATSSFYTPASHPSSSSSPSSGTYHTPAPAAAGAASILTLPPEILTQICLDACTSHRTGPPREARALCLTCRAFNGVLSWRANAPLYAAVFAAQFDLAAARRRARARERDDAAGSGQGGEGEGEDLFRSERVGDELRRRWTALTRMRLTAAARTLSHLSEPELEADLWTALVLLLEDDGSNLPQLCEYARIDEYMHVFWRERLLRPSMADPPQLPEETVARALGLWVLWHTCSERLLEHETPLIQHTALFALRPYAFAAHKYDIFAAPWYEPVLPLLPPGSSEDDPNNIDALFGDPPSQAASEPRHQIPYFGTLLPVEPPPAGLAAIMLFSLRTSFRSAHPLASPLVSTAAALTMPLAPVAQPMHHTAPPTAANTAHGQALLEIVRPPFAHELRGGRGSGAWDGDWRRMTRCWDLMRGRGLAVGETDVSGVWEGKFTFFDFDSYRDMLTGSARSVYEGAFAEQPQVWRLTARRARIADSLRRQILAERRERGAAEGEMTGLASVVDDQWRWGEEELVLQGSGHSAWGEFNLVGNVRTWDGLVSLRKEYTPAARGTWLYRGYLVGDNYLVGRWRDTFTEKTQDGYEGIFALARRS
ncbi:hypothetical protein CALCODRAFT_504884 [Calocera cornea HHB12733]|uniref:F-box domain-containing protein n=1 Tax=Calocera cornea HHB12733 TaxID=1353952 RepID=A0A165C603_9BASI|nr:hypothetical protein CALCODRAFT_504884 [Calocera cornea HHB12733]